MPRINRLSQLDLNKTYSYADYLTWRLNERIELIKGKVMLMSHTPCTEHQRIERQLLIVIGWYLKNKKCEILPAPVDVRLYDRKKSLLPSKEIYTVVQPDLCVVCDPDVLDKQGCNGAPDWIIEILSKGDSKREMQIKYELYAESGVTEYWIVYPEHTAIHQFVLNENHRYELVKMYTDDERVASHLFPKLVIDLTDVFV